jgi:hypothetical protein
MPVDESSKKQAIAEIIDGTVIDDSDRVAVSIKGTVKGFPARFEAINTGWPFGVVYTLETNLVAAGNLLADPNQQPDLRNDCKITIYPRMGRGMMGIVTKLLLFEASGQSVGDKKLEKTFNFSYDEREVAERFIRYPGVADHLMALEDSAKFSELVIRTRVGVYLAQPSSFNSLDIDVCRATFNSLGEMAQVLFEAFSN